MNPAKTTTAKTTTTKTNQSKKRQRKTILEEHKRTAASTNTPTHQDGQEQEETVGYLEEVHNPSKRNCTNVQKRSGVREVDQEAPALRDGPCAATGYGESPIRVPLEIGGKVVMAFVDTGASVNLVRTDLVQGQPQEKVDVTLRMVSSGLTKKATGAMDLATSLAGMPFTFRFLTVDNLQEEVILGRPFMREADVSVQWNRGIISYGITRRHTHYWRDAKGPSRTALTPDELQRGIEDKVPQERREEYLEEIKKFADVFSEEPIPATAIDTQHHIVLRDKVPVRIPPYRCSEEKKREINKACQEMLAQGIIRRSRSDYNSPALLVKKKDGTKRFCVDYRQLNAKTEAEVGTLPQIFDTIRELGDAQYFTTLDLKAGYWQVPMAEASKKYTAFSTPDGDQYEFEVMPFGLTGAPGTFQKLMTQVLEGQIHRFVKVYLDDIVIYSKTHEEHLYHLAAVLERLREHGLHVAPGKCRFGARQIDYLGHTITSERNEPQTHYLQKIKDYPVPRNIKELRSFLGTAGWLREYVPAFAEIAAPLTDVLEGKRGFRWAARQQEAFEDLKEALANHAELHRPLPGVQFCLQTDASSVGMGAVLFQFDPQDKEKRRLIACASAKFTKTEARYHVNEQEVLAVIWGVKKFRQFLEDHVFVLYTDSRALLWLHKYKDEKSKLMRWALMLQAYCFTVVHVPGRCNELPDFLSRNPEPMNRPEQPEEVDDRAYPIYMAEMSDDSSANEGEEDEEEPPPARQEEEDREDEEAQRLPQPLFQEILEAQRNDHDCRAERTRLQLVLLNGPQTREEEKIARDYFVEDDVIWRRNNDEIVERRSLLVPPELRDRVLEEYHDSALAAHPGRDETLRAIRRMYDWQGMATDVQDYVRACLVCASTKASRQEAAPLRPRVPTAPWRTVSLDVLGPYPATRSRNRYIIVIVDLFSKWLEARATPKGTQTRILKFLGEVTARWGFPESLITDNGTPFRGREWGRYMEQHQIAHYTAPIYHQRANPVERRVQELKKILRTKDAALKRWDSYLDEALFTLRNRTSAATGQAPAEVLFGVTLPRPGEWAVPETVRPMPDRTAEARRRRIDQARARQEIYTRKIFPAHREADTEFQPGQEVMVREFRQSKDPFQARWTGPHEVIERHGDSTYTVERDGLYVKVHIDDLRPRPPERRE